MKHSEQIKNTIWKKKKVTGRQQHSPMWDLLPPESEEAITHCGRMDGSSGLSFTWDGAPRTGTAERLAGVGAGPALLPSPSPTLGARLSYQASQHMCHLLPSAPAWWHSGQMWCFTEQRCPNLCSDGSDQYVCCPNMVTMSHLWQLSTYNVTCVEELKFT